QHAVLQRREAEIQGGEKVGVVHPRDASDAAAQKLECSPQPSVKACRQSPATVLHRPLDGGNRDTAGLRSNRESAFSAFGPAGLVFSESSRCDSPLGPPDWP